MKVLKFPVSWVCLQFILGILVSDHFGFVPEDLFFAVLLSTVFLLGSFIYSQKNIFKNSIFGISVLICSFVSGLMIFALNNQLNRKDNYFYFIKENQLQQYQVSVKELLKSSANYDRYVVEVKRIDEQLSSGKLLLNLKKDSLRTPFDVGENFIFQSKIYKNQIVTHAFQFDYGKYLNRKSIFAQTYIYNNKIQKLNKIDKNLSYYASKIRSRIVNNLERRNFPDRELQVVNALILGQQQNIEADIVKDYQYAGAVHILSVSGLHVGFIVLFLNFVLKNVYNSRIGNFFKLVVVLVSLICFAILAGLSPPVVRAVTMFCFISIGIYIRRKTNIYHTLLVSMLLILFFEPSFLFDVGFQLSYLALFFIIWFQPILKKFYKPVNPFMKYFWDILTVSFAAQIGTMPLSLYYFHQFPTLFFVTNIVILPTLGILMILGVLVMLLAYIDWVPGFLIYLLENGVYINNIIINRIASFENFVIKNIGMNQAMMLSVFAVIICFIMYLDKPKLKKFYVFVFSILIFQCCYLYTKFRIEREEELVFFNDKEISLAVNRIGKESVLITNQEEKRIINNYNLNSYLQYNFSEIAGQQHWKNFNYINGFKVFVLNNQIDFNMDFETDIVLLSQSPKINLERFIHYHRPKSIIADGTNYKYLINYWRITCNKYKIPFHALGDKGLYVLKK